MGFFLEDTPQRLDHIRDALVDNDCKRLERAAHTLKGSVGIYVPTVPMRRQNALNDWPTQGRGSASRRQ